MTTTGSSGLGEALRRFSTLVLLSVIVCAAAAAALSYRGSTSYTGDALYLVPPGVNQSTSEAVTPFDAERIARTYAVVLAEDEDLLDELGESVGRDRSDVADRVTAVALPNSSAIRVTYEGTQRNEVTRYFTALTDAVEDSSPPTDNLRTDTVRLLQAPDEIRATGGGTWVAPVAGALAGLLIGLAAASLLARANPTVEGADDLREPGGPSVVEVDLGAPPSVEALALRLLDGAPPGAAVAVVSSTGRDRGRAQEVSDRTRAAAEDLVRAGLLPASATAVSWTAAGMGDGRGERAAQLAARTLVVVPAGSALRDVAGAVGDLHDLGVTDLVLAVVHAGGRPREAARVAQPDHDLVGSAGGPDARDQGR